MLNKFIDLSNENQQLLILQKETKKNIHCVSSPEEELSIAKKKSNLSLVKPLNPTDYFQEKLGQTTCKMWYECAISTI